MDLLPLGRPDLGALTAFAQRADVARHGDHLVTDPRSVWEAWLGEADANRQITIAVRERGAIACAAKVSTISRRRRSHVGVVDLLAPWSGHDDAIGAALGAIVDASDRWLQLARLELRVPAGHPRIPGVYAQHGFAVETSMVHAVLRDGAFADEVSLARVRPGTAPGSAVAGPPPAPPRRPPPERVELRATVPEDGPEWTLALSHEAVVWGTLQLPHQRAEIWEKRLAENDPRQVVSVAAVVDGELAGGGVLVLPSVLRRRHVATLGMHVAPAHQGRGVGTRLMAELLAMGDRLGLERIDLEVFADNPRAVRLYEAAGFVHEGRRALACFRDGALVDDLMMARVRR